MAKLPTEYEAFFLQLMASYLEGMTPATTYEDGVKEFTTQQVAEAISPMLEADLEQIYDHLIGEGYVPKRIGDELFWLGKVL